MLQTRQVRSGHYLVRLKFRAHCPYDVFKQAIYGTDLRGRPESSSPEFESRIWR